MIKKQERSFYKERLKVLNGLWLSDHERGSYYLSKSLLWDESKLSKRSSVRTKSQDSHVPWEQ